MRLPLNSSGIFSLEQSHITVTVVLVNTNLTYRLHSRYQSTVEFQLSATIKQFRNYMRNILLRTIPHYCNSSAGEYEFNLPTA